jgi:hypothetical protein
MDDLSLITPVLQTLSSGLVLLSMYFARCIHSRLREMERIVMIDRLELERKIAALRLDTQVAIAELKNQQQ